MSTINYLTRIEFAEGAIARLPELLAGLGVKSPLIATDAGLVATGLVAKVADLLENATVFAETPRTRPKRR
ncbi:iron-containing alcohol dehydrogenase [Gemmobacter sp. 24YEA27]|uniref:iron-containing alcohol dehydrogenase n=1 Tax=Gemmobacter sp. 24YEA27 TaxID=3040672 RepID=UPI0024B353FC|nr:iron-containing alcohol dehydrogenase [Gemmobacter sp. 24YEA27]